MNALILAAIRFYQRFLSPLKGFRCAYHAHTGRQSCSHLGFRAVRRYGALSGLVVLRQRLFLCGVAHRRYSLPLRRPPLAQRGDCDIGCDLPCDGGCDMPDMRSCRMLGDCASNCGSCDWRQRKRNRSEQDIHLPPRKPMGNQ